MKIFYVLPAPNEQTQRDWIIIPDSCVMRSGNPFFIPDFAESFRGRPVVAIRLSRLGKSIARRFAPRYYETATVGFSIFASDLLEKIRCKGLPWSPALVFDKSLFLGEFMPHNQIFAVHDATVKAGVDSIHFSPADCSSEINSIIEELSKTNTLKTGDIILIPASSESMELKQGTTLSIASESLPLFQSNIK